MKFGGGRRNSIINHGEERWGFCKFTLVFFFFFFFVLAAVVGAQPSDPQDNTRQPYARFSPSLAVIVVVLVSALFFMGFFCIYIRHCSDSSGAVGSLGRALSTRARRAAAARGLDRAVLETFPTFSYAEVKDHMIGKGTLECAVCLNEFEPDETLRLLPKCDHVFHSDCIDAWLDSHVTCPVCRANLAEDPVQAPTEEAAPAAVDTTTRNEEIAIQVVAEDPATNRNASFEYPNRPPRSWSVKMPRMLSLGKFRSHSTGHSVVQPVENLDRFTLRLPAQVRKDMIDRAMLNRTSSSLATSTLPCRESSSRTGYRGGGEEGSSRGGRSHRWIEIGDRWGFFSRALSMKSPKVGAETREGSTSNKNGPVKITCLEPKANEADEIHPISNDSSPSLV